MQRNLPLELEVIFCVRGVGGPPWGNVGWTPTLVLARVEIVGDYPPTRSSPPQCS